MNSWTQDRHDNSMKGFPERQADTRPKGWPDIETNRQMVQQRLSKPDGETDRQVLAHKGKQTEARANGWAGKSTYRHQRQSDDHADRHTDRHCCRQADGCQADTQTYRQPNSETDNQTDFGTRFLRRVGVTSGHSDAGRRLVSGWGKRICLGLEVIVPHVNLLEVKTVRWTDCTSRAAVRSILFYVACSFFTGNTNNVPTGNYCRCRSCFVFCGPALNIHLREYVS